MRKSSIRRVVLLAVMVVVIFLLSSTAFAATQACDGCTLGTFNGSPACVSGGNLHICNNNFPDEIMFNHATYTVDTDEDGYLTTEEASAITEFNNTYGGMKSTSGLEFYTSITKIFLHTHDITELDVSKLTALEDLRCVNCNLTSLDLSNNKALKYLDCEGNDLTELDLSNNPNLEDLDCSWNELTWIDVSKNTALWQLSASYNQLTQIDVRNNPELMNLGCNDNPITSLDLSNNKKLVYLYCSYTNLAELDVSQNTALQYLYVENNKLTSKLDLSANTALVEFSCMENDVPEVILNSKALVYLDCRDNRIPRLEIGECPVLEELYCSNNQLTKLDVSGYSELTKLFCSGNQLTTLNVSGNSKLVSLDCGYNLLTSLDLSNNPELLRLEVHGNDMTMLDLRACSNLNDLSADDQMTEWFLRYEAVDGGYALNMAEFVGAENIGNVVSVTDGEYDAATGIVVFANQRRNIYYTYNTGAPAARNPNMRVTVYHNDAFYVSDDTDATKNACGATLGDYKDDLVYLLLTKEERNIVETGVAARFRLDVQDISATVSSGDKAAVQSVLGNNTVGCYLDISLYKQIGDGAEQEITQAISPVTVCLTIPEEMQAEGRAYRIIRVNNSGAEVLQTEVSEYGDSLSFQTDHFSTYALVYSAPGELFDIGYANMTLGNSLAMNFAFAQDTYEDWSGCYARIVKTYADYRGDKVVDVPFEQWGKVNIGGKVHWLVTFPGVAAKEMSDAVYVTLYDAGGNAISNAWEDSVRSYAMRLLNNPTTALETQIMAVDLLNYGAEAQGYFNYNYEDLANSELTNAQKALATKSAEAENICTSSEMYKGTNLGLESQILMRMAFTGVKSDMYAKIEFTNHAGREITVDVASNEIINGVVVIDEIVIADGRRPITVTVYNADGSVYATATDSMESYIARMGEDFSLFVSILKFSDSAYNFFH